MFFDFKETCREEMNGFEKEVDSLGRVVIPMTIRRALGIESNSKVSVTLQDGTVVMMPAIKKCALCGSKISEEMKFRLCAECVSQVKEYAVQAENSKDL